MVSDARHSMGRWLEQYAEAEDELGGAFYLDAQAPSALHRRIATLTGGKVTSEKMGQITDKVLWWPLMLVERMRPGPLKFVCNVLSLILALPCTLMAIPFMFLTFILDIWEDSN